MRALTVFIEVNKKNDKMVTKKWPATSLKTINQYYMSPKTAIIYAINSFVSSL